MRKLFEAAVFVAMLTAPAAAQSQLEADKSALQTCIDDAFPEGELLGAPREHKTLGDCIGLIERSGAQLCSASSACMRRETDAWLALARAIETQAMKTPNRTALKAAVGSIERQARAICTAAAAVSA